MLLTMTMGAPVVEGMIGATEVPVVEGMIRATEVPVVEGMIGATEVPVAVSIRPTLPQVATEKSS